MLRALGAVRNALVAFEKVVLLASLGGMLLAVLASILARPLGLEAPWAHPLVLALMIVATFAGAALATATRRHITMDLATKALSQRGRTVLMALTGILGAGISGILAAAGTTWVRTNMEFDDPISLALKIPDWYLQAVVPAGFALFAVHFLMNAAQDIRALITSDYSHLADVHEGSAHGVQL